jgi:hypothetical protein
MIEENARENLFDAIAFQKTCASTQQRYYLEYSIDGQEMGSTIKCSGKKAIHIFCATDTPILDCRLIGTEGEVARYLPEKDGLRLKVDEDRDIPAGFYYPRITTANNNLAWASPIWIE